MHELLKKLLDAEVLTEETKQELEGAFTQQINEAIESARQEAQAAITAELNEQWITERNILIEALDSKVTETLAEELTELKQDIENFRDLEAEYATKIVEAKAELSTTLKSDIAQLIEKLDTFLEIQLEAELEELRDDINEVKKNEFGRKVFESFVTEFKKHYASDDSIEAKLNETEYRLQDTMAALAEAEKKNARMQRSIKMDQVLAPLSGQTREVMEAILKKVDTELLDEAYKTYIGRVLRETSKPEATSEKEDKVLAEGEKEKTIIEGVAVSGNADVVVESLDENDSKASDFSDEKARLRRLAGLA